MTCSDPWHPNITVCVQEEMICDGYAHCWDARDEVNCTCDKYVTSTTYMHISVHI